MKSISRCLLALFLLSNLLLSSDFTNRLKNYPVYWIGKQRYVSLQTIIKILGVGSWGRIEDRIFIEYQGKILKGSIGTADFYVDDRRVSLDHPIREIEKEVFIPVEPFDQIISTITVSIQQKEPAKPSENPVIAEKEKPTIASKSNPVRDFIILIDPGHGGHDNGAVGNYGLKEKDVNLDISLRLRSYLTGYFKKGSKIIVKMTREDDRFLSLDERVEIAKKEKADIFFCVHTNSSRLNRWNADGFETYYPSRKSEISFASTAQPDESAESETNTEVVFQIVSELNTTSVIEESRILAEIVQEKLAERL
ncbi:MAG: N-acetylmuramoyl-L-alanine amidase, partial [Candidatus Omnitrophica bacterium]|nr:N-acetylmuramoyl-L-alanine amidase [Candidatus Omnitrophota bacterium]